MGEGSKLGILKSVFGHDSFRDGQETVIDALSGGRDALAVMPTGSGKSICYEIPALMATGITLVVSPLISLMKDQVMALKASGISAAYINSSLTAAQQRLALERAKSGAYKIIYAAPERLGTSEFVEFALDADISLIAIDEAHCVSAWGQDFRPAYLLVADFVDRLPKRPPVGAFTATATELVRMDMEKMLRLCDPVRVTTGFDRENLRFSVETPKKKIDRAIELVKERSELSGIIYCATRKAVDQVYGELSVCGIRVSKYHAGMGDDERRASQDDFLYDRTPVMVATNAFGMGIDKSNVSYVIHYNMPKDVESYYQEAGRAGRDGSAAECILLYSKSDIITAKFLIDSPSGKSELSETERETIRARDIARLDAMVGYCETTDCLRNAILAYFGETRTEPCGNCGNCESEKTVIDVTRETHLALAAMESVENELGYGFGYSRYVEFMFGRRSKKLKELGLDKLPEFGVLKSMDKDELRCLLDTLISQGYITRKEGIPVLVPGTRELLPGENVLMTRIERSGEEHTEKKKTRTSKKSIDVPEQPSIDDDELIKKLRSVRTRLAEKRGVPAFMILSNASLDDMAKKRPKDRSGLLRVSGIGEFKADKYGAEFLEAINGTGAKAQSASSSKAAAAKREPPKPIAKKAAAEDGNGELLLILKTLRLRISTEEETPPYYIFTDDVLIEMAEKRPSTIDELLMIKGTSPRKCRGYGQEFINEIKAYEKKSGR